MFAVGSEPPPGCPGCGPLKLEGGEPVPEPDPELELESIIMLATPIKPIAVTGPGLLVSAAKSSRACSKAEGGSLMTSVTTDAT